MPARPAASTPSMPAMVAGSGGAGLASGDAATRADWDGVTSGVGAVAADGIADATAMTLAR